MAHFAELSKNSVVKQVIVIDNVNTLDVDGNESEAQGIKFCKSLYGEHTEWVQTSYTATFRKHFAGIGFKYDRERDAFIPPPPYPSWVLDESVYQWKPPVPYPTDSKFYEWDEPTVSWIEIT